LRELQENLGTLVSQVARARDALARRIPLLVKLSPDERDADLKAMAEAAVAAGADGIVATNTTLDRSAVQAHPHAAQAGGLSGAPLRDRAQQICALLYRSVRVPIIGVGGIATAEDAYSRIRAGASAVQVYTALVYRGPSVARGIAGGLQRLLERDGLTLREAIGRDAL
jgi:dihydroorotate dehydrogenase